MKILLDLDFLLEVSASTDAFDFRRIHICHWFQDYKVSTLSAQPFPSSVEQLTSSCQLIPESRASVEQDGLLRLRHLRGKLFRPESSRSH